MNPKKHTFTLAALLALVGLFAGIAIFQHLHAPKKFDLNKFHGTYLAHPRTIHPFSLKGIDGKTFDNQSLKGQWTLMFFGFTRCGSVCPTTMAKLAKMVQTLEKTKVVLPQVVMISIDPDRDSLDRLKQYVQAFNPHFYGARGKESKIESMTQEMGIVYQKITPSQELPENYDIQHSGAVMLFNPQGQLNAFFNLPHHANLLAKDYMLLVSFAKNT